MEDKITYDTLKAKMKKGNIYHFSTEDCPNIIHGYPYVAALLFLNNCEKEGYNAEYIGERLNLNTIPLNDIIEDKKPELEEISLEDREKIYLILYPSCQLYSRTIEELEEILKRAYIPTHKIKVNA